MLEDPGASPEDYVIQSSLSSELERMMTHLTPQQREVIKLRFGLVDGQSMTLARIGEVLNISRERVRQIEREALTRLRRCKTSMSEYLVS
jgi:RNA polymerase nonessential primary-like sigma factor